MLKSRFRNGIRGLVTPWPLTLLVLIGLLWASAQTLMAQAFLVIDEINNVPPEGLFVAEVQPGGAQNWFFDLLEPRGEYSVHMSQFQPEDSELRAFIAGQEFSIFNEGDFFVSLEAGINQLIIFNPGPLPVQYNLILGASHFISLVGAGTQHVKISTELALHDGALASHITDNDDDFSSLNTFLAAHSQSLVDHNLALDSHAANTATNLASLSVNLGDHNSLLTVHHDALGEHNILVSGQVVNVLAGLASHDGSLANHNFALTDHASLLTVHNTALGEHNDLISNQVVGVLGGLAAIDGSLTNHDANLTARADAIVDLLNLLNSALGEQVEMKRVHLQVIEIKKDERSLLASSEGGQPVDVYLIALEIAGGVKKNDPIEFTDAMAFTDVVAVKTGILDVRLELPKGIKKPELLEFRVRHDHGGGAPHFGTVLVTDKGKDGLGGGQ